MQQVEKLNEDKEIIPMVEEEATQQQTIEDLSNVRIDIKGLNHLQKGLVVGNSYSIAVTTFKGQPIKTIDGIQWECDGAFIEPNIGNDVKC